MQFVNNIFFSYVPLFCFIFAAFITTPHATAQDENTTWYLETCIDHAWNNNLQLQQQKLSVDFARENLSQNKAARYPNLNASAAHAYNFGRTVDPFTNQF
ncbi:MAG: TolC family protein, partial [Bacteroidota bacterium]